MSKRAEELALKMYPVFIWYDNNAYNRVDANREQRVAYKQGYEQAEHYLVSLIREQVERWMPKDNGEEYIKGERTAFNSVLHLLKEMEEE